MTTDVPGNVPLNAGLGPLPAPHMRESIATAQNTHSVRHGYEQGGYVRWPDMYTAEQMRAYAAAAVAAERERMIADGWRQTRYVAPVTDCEACLTPDACAIRGQCGHYLRERA